MKTKSLTLVLTVTVAAFALLATPAQAGGKKYKKYRDNDCYRGGNSYGYYQQRNSYRPVQYYRPAYPVAPVYAPRPFIQIGFGFGGNRGYCR